MRTIPVWFLPQFNSRTSQHKKKYQDEKSHLPGGSNILQHTAELLIQAEGVAVQEGEWGGGAWFVSVSSVIELRKRVKIHSTFVVKNNTNLYPMRVLHRLLKVRYGERPAGHWLVMLNSISDVPIFSIVYAWSQRRVSYFISTCGNTEISDTKYMYHFEDDWVNITAKEINRPQILHYLY